MLSKMSGLAEIIDFGIDRTPNKRCSDEMLVDLEKKNFGQTMLRVDGLTHST